MTVITAVITQHCIAIATDSFLTSFDMNGNSTIEEGEQSKIVPIRSLRAAASYWGLAEYGSWSTYRWLQEKAKEANQQPCLSLQEFCQLLREDLEEELNGISVQNEIVRGIGIHITGYERISDYWIRNYLSVVTSLILPTKVCAVCT